MLFSVLGCLDKPTQELGRQILMLFWNVSIHILDEILGGWSQSNQPSNPLVRIELMSPYTTRVVWLFCQHEM
jgi:hypothetical protein